MADVITRFKLETTQYDSKLRDASKGLAEYTRKATLAGNEFGKFTQKNIEAARALGTITPSATNAKDKVKELVGAFNDAAKAYNALTKEQQQSDFGKAMAESISQLNVKIKEAKQELYGMDDAMKKAGSGGGLFAGLGDKMSGALQVFAGNMLTKAAGAVANLGSEMYGMVQQGIELAKQGEGIRIAFERLGRGDILDGLRQATHGTVTDLELMKAAVKFNDFKLPVEELGTMLAFAQQKAKDTGQSVDYMVDSIVTGLGRKSLMILDNLGLSASEVKDRMAETGDMTKAVGDIIREQMAKAGDYVETAADRAAQANVSLQNKMEELGRKFAPVEEASSQLWTSMKIGILDIIGGPLATLLNQLTEAGRLKNMLNNLNGEPGSGNTKVDQQVKKLNVIKKAGGSNYIFNSTLSGMMEDYNRQIMALDAQIKNDGKPVGGGSGSSQDVRYLQQKMDALKIMRDQLAAGAKELSKPVDVKIETKGAEQNVESLKLKLIELEAQRKKAIAAGDTDLSKNLAKQITQVKSDIKGLGGSTTVKTQKNLPEYADFNKQLFKSMSGGGDDLKQEIPHFSVFETFKDQAKFDPENILGSKDVWEEYKNTITDSIGGIGESMNNLSFDNFQESYEKVGKDVDKLTKSAKKNQMAMGLASQAVGAFGSALSSMEDPGAKAAGTVMQAIASIALGFAMASSQANTAGTGWGWLAWLAAGMAAMATTVSTVHSLTGYAQGGMIEGNSYSGDNIGGMVDGSQLVGLNAGEVVLTKAMQGNLASQLQGNGINGINLSGRIKGTDIILSVDRSLQLQGKQLLTWG